MIKPSTAILGGVALSLVVLLACACASSASSASSASARASAPTVASTCQQVSAVLSDGPDPDADPVGYAEAQILPLRQISVSDRTLRTAINQLADAYQRFYASSGKSSDAKESIAVASKKLDSTCPGAAS